METVSTDKLCLDDIRCCDLNLGMVAVASRIESALNKLLQDSAGYPEIKVGWINEPHPTENQFGRKGFFRIQKDP